MYPVKNRFYTDRELIDHIISNNNRVIEYLFFEKCNTMFTHIVARVFQYQVNKDELINELYIYLAENNWEKVRQFNFQSKFTTWLSVVAVRYFIKKREGLIENGSTEALIIEKEEHIQEDIHRKLDVKYLMDRMSNDRYRFTITELILNERKPDEVANEMGITIDNLYNIKKRALKQLMDIIKRDSGKAF